MLSMEFSPATIIVALALVVLVFLAARRLHRNGTCDCHKGSPRGKGAHAQESAGCSGCSSCAACASCAIPLTSFDQPNDTQTDDGRPLS
ncbi:FeoB-associated Cys-rich membrane protein [Eggerthella sp. YY7918]|uniref:FeoB-associated Cys-rich membrane protein n=1 Tax=Eggerthella sp. (strain YY7918) TaxID=502558 RepID=UPI00031DF2DF|nr:FeoB-associated Cys-rich membrane protein [Eggerthella sp. YY7918]